jgi:putative sigma-54 modulation protein
MSARGAHLGLVKGVGSMKFYMNAKNTSVSEAMQEKAEKKVGKFAKFFRPDTEAHLTFDVEKDRNIFEVTLKSKGLFIRAEETTDDMYASIDLVIEKLERQIRKYKTRLGKRIHQEAMVPENYDIEEPIDEESEHRIVRTKRFTFKPMDVEEAILQMNLLGHAFFVFTNAEDEQVNVVYKRKNGDYGLITPDF